MKAKIVDLRYRTKDVLASLERGEAVEITSHGKLKGIIEPVKTGNDAKALRVQEHPMFGIATSDFSVDQVVGKLRDTRYS